MTVIGLLHPGEMGAALGAAFVSTGGHRVLWDPNGRGPASARRAAAAGLEAASSLAALAAEAELIISICPPHAARDVASAVAACRFGGIYLDANAISPAKAAEVAALVEAGGATFVDGDVIGGPPTPGSGTTRLFVSGDPAAAVAVVEVADRSGLDAIDLGPDPTRASALKMCYAAWTKGHWALLTAILAAADQLGVADALVAEWERSQPGLATRADHAARANARKAWRFVGEMGEIADTFETVGLPGGFARAAAEVYRRLDGFKDVAEPDLTRVLAAVTAQPRPAEPGGGPGGEPT